MSLSSSDSIITRTIQKQKSVVATLLVSSHDNTIISSSVDNIQSNMYGGANIKALGEIAMNAVRDLDPENCLCNLRIRTRKYEIIVGYCDECWVVVVQNPNE